MSKSLDNKTGSVNVYVNTGSGSIITSDSGAVPSTTTITPDFSQTLLIGDSLNDPSLSWAGAADKESIVKLLELDGNVVENNSIAGYSTISYLSGTAAAAGLQVFWNRPDTTYTPTRVILAVGTNDMLRTRWKVYFGSLFTDEFADGFTAGFRQSLYTMALYCALNLKESDFFKEADSTTNFNVYRDDAANAAQFGWSYRSTTSLVACSSTFSNVVGRYIIVPLPVPRDSGDNECIEDGTGLITVDGDAKVFYWKNRTLRNSLNAPIVNNALVIDTKSDAGVAHTVVIDGTPTGVYYLYAPIGFDKTSFTVPVDLVHPNPTAPVDPASTFSAMVPEPRQSRFSSLEGIYANVVDDLKALGADVRVVRGSVSQMNFEDTVHGNSSNVRRQYEQLQNSYTL